MKICTGKRYQNESLHMPQSWHGKFGHLNVLKLDHESECTNFGKHDRIVTYGDFSGRIDKVWNLGTPSDKDIVKFYKKEWDRRGKFKVIKTFEDENTIEFKLIKKD